ncbi:MAG: hypothetical protein OEM77_00560 [Nitrosopumilus sp.]|nr:hypothetical protein [Nitrosopumilus sp.]MDH3823079.1 hypothetical protein [Nitrosopumilus sp.]MDH3833605.1 hypothetical protein [Nitrosopumilus sp.]
MTGLGFIATNQVLSGIFRLKTGEDLGKIGESIVGFENPLTL